MNMENLTRKEKREMRMSEEGRKHHHLRTRQALRWAVVVVIVLMLGGYFGYAFNNWRKSLPERAYTTSPVHWHAKVSVEICGQARELPSDNALTAHGKGAVGIPLLHHHYDGLAHIEGMVLRPEQITLGAFFDAIGGKFSDTEIFEKKNGDACGDGKEGIVKILINDTEVVGARDYVLQDGDDIAVKFE